MSSSVLVTGQIAPTEQEQSPAPSSILTSEQIVQRQAISLPDLLYTQPGISFARTGPVGGLTTLFLDGGNSNYTKVFIDGTPANEPGGNFDYSNLSLDNIDKVEVVHGAESTLYGSDAMSGVIQLFSHRGTTEIPSFTLFSDGGNLSSGRGGGQVSGLLGKFDYSGAGSYLSTAGQGPNDSFINRSLAGNAGYSFSDTDQVRLTVRSNSSWAAIPGPTLLEPPTLGQYYAYQDLTANLAWTFKTGDHWQHRLSGWDSRIVDPITSLATALRSSINTTSLPSTSSPTTPSQRALLRSAMNMRSKTLIRAALSESRTRAATIRPASPMVVGSPYAA